MCVWLSFVKWETAGYKKGEGSWTPRTPGPFPGVVPWELRIWLLTLLKSSLPRELPLTESPCLKTATLHPLSFCSLSSQCCLRRSSGICPKLFILSTTLATRILSHLNVHNHPNTHASFSRPGPFLSYCSQNELPQTQICWWTSSGLNSFQLPQAFRNLSRKPYPSSGLLLCPASLKSVAWSEIDNFWNMYPWTSEYICDATAACTMELEGIWLRWSLFGPSLFSLNFLKCQFP